MKFFATFSAFSSAAVLVAANAVTVAAAGAAAAGMPDAVPDKAKKAGCSRTLQVAVSPIGRSMIISPEGKISGSTPEFLELIKKDTGCEFAYQVVPRARALFMLERGQIDLITDATRAPNRDEVANFLQTAAARPMLISLRSKQVKIYSVPDLIASTTTLITFSGHYWGQEYLALLANPKMQGRFSAASSPEVALNMLIHGRADAILTGQAVLVDAREQVGQGVELDIRAMEGLPELKVGMYMSKARMSRQDMDLIRSACLARIRSGDLSRIVNAYYPAWAIYSFKTNKTELRKAGKNQP